MATTTTIMANGSAYGNTANDAFTQVNGSHIYIGKDSTTYDSRLRFPSLKSIAAIGNNTISIKSIVFSMYRNDGDGGNRSYNVGFTTSSAWRATRYGTISASASSASGVKYADITSMSNYIKDASGNWYLYFRSDATRMRFIAPHGSASYYKPRIVVTWEYVANTIKTEVDSVSAGEDVTFNITPGETDASYTLTYSAGDITGTIVENTADTAITWAVPAEIASELPNDESGQVTVSMKVYDSDGVLLRTEVLYLTVDIPETVKPIISDVSLSAVNGLNGYVLTNKSHVSIIPTIDMNSAYSATIQSVTAKITDGANTQTIEWTEFVESDPGIYVLPAAATNIITTAGETQVEITVIDSRGRTVTETTTITTLAYSPPVISSFLVDRYEPVYDANEEIVGYEVSDTGEYVFVTLDASVTDLNPEGTPMNSISWELAATVIETGETTTYTGESDSTSVSFYQDRNIIEDLTSALNSVQYLLTVRDTAGSVSYREDIVAEGRANFALAKSKYGACFGGLPKGTQANPMLESYYPFHAYDTIYAHGGIEGAGFTYPKTNGTYTDPSTGEEQFTGNYWVNGKPIYRRTASGYIGATNTDVSFQTIPRIDKPIRVYGYADVNATNTTFVPINCFVTTNWKANVVLSSDSTATYVIANCGFKCNIHVVIEFTKPD